MAHATYEADSEDFVGTQSVTANNDYVLYNNTKCGMNITVVHDSDDDYDVSLSSGEGQVYRAAASGTVTFTGVPHHTGVTATQPATHTNNDGLTLATGSASLVFTPF